MFRLTNEILARCWLTVAVAMAGSGFVTGCATTAPSPAPKFDISGMQSTVAAPAGFVATVTRVELRPRTKADFAADRAAGVFNNWCGAETATFQVERWIEPPSGPTSVELEMFIDEWCTPSTTMGPKSVLVLIEPDRPEPDLIPLEEIQGKFYFRPQHSPTLAGVDLKPLFVDQPMSEEYGDANSADKANLERAAAVGVCVIDGKFKQCRSVPLESFIPAYRATLKGQSG